MSTTRSILLIFLSFAVGFIGPLLVEMARESSLHLTFEFGSLPVLIMLAVLWGTPRGITERKLLEALLGAGLAFVGLYIISVYSEDFIGAVVARARQSGLDVVAKIEETVGEEHGSTALAVIVRNAILGLFIGAIDGLYEHRAGKAGLGAVLAALLTVPGVFVERFVVHDSQHAFAFALSWGVIICLIHIGTILTQFLTGAKHHKEGRRRE